MNLQPCRDLEQALYAINEAFRCNPQCYLPGRSTPYWLCFGGLWGLIQADGVIPDGDLDICTYYGQDWQAISAGFTAAGYHVSKVLLGNEGKALYMAMNHPSLPHICLSFWYESRGIRWYCHDQKDEVRGPMVPPSGYWFKGVPAEAVEGDDRFCMVEWPGIPGRVKVRVPLLPGVILDHLYPAWAYRKQRYNANYSVNKDRMASYHKGGAVSPYMVHVRTMSDWGDEGYIAGEMVEAKKVWARHIKGERV